MKNNNSILITIVLGICILIGAWYFQVFTDYEVPSRILAAILGVVITAIITQLLLNSQTNKEVTKTSLVAMHCKPKNLDSVSAAVRNVISSVCPSDEEKKQKSQGKISLLESLLVV